jgi:CBF/Mak21 family
LRAKLFTAPTTAATDTTATSDTSDNDDTSNSEEPITAVPGSIIAGYDPQKRDPRYAFSTTASGGSGSTGGQQQQQQPLWEVTLLRWHYHPSVQHFATQLLTPPGHGIRYYITTIVTVSV